MKTRSSSGVGQKVDLEFDIDALRIRDSSMIPNYKLQDARTKYNNLDGLKTRSTVSETNTEESAEQKVAEVPNEQT